MYNERGDILRTIDNVMVDTGGTHYFDRVYTLDALGRVLGEERGNWNGTGIGTTREDRNWALTAVGNWASRDYDLDGLGTDFAEDNTPIGTHFNNANEWIQRNITTGGSPVTPDYDANGNLIDDGKDYVYEYDAWNRLTSISTTGGSPTLVAEYRYNGLKVVLPWAHRRGRRHGYRVSDGRRPWFTGSAADPSPPAGDRSRSCRWRPGPGAPGRPRSGGWCRARRCSQPPPRRRCRAGSPAGRG